MSVHNSNIDSEKYLEWKTAFKPELKKALEGYTIQIVTGVNKKLKDCINITITGPDDKLLSGEAGNKVIEKIMEFIEEKFPETTTTKFDYNVSFAEGKVNMSINNNLTELLEYAKGTYTKKITNTDPDGPAEKEKGPVKQQQVKNTGNAVPIPPGLTGKSLQNFLNRQRNKKEQGASSALHKHLSNVVPSASEKSPKAIVKKQEGSQGKLGYMDGLKKVLIVRKHIKHRLGIDDNTEAVKCALKANGRVEMSLNITCPDESSANYIYAESTRLMGNYGITPNISKDGNDVSFETHANIDTILDKIQRNEPKIYQQLLGKVFSTSTIIRDK